MGRTRAARILSAAIIAIAGCTHPRAPDPIGDVFARTIAPEIRRSEERREAPPAPQGPLGPREAIRLARLQNPGLRAARADLDEAAARRGSAAAALWPQAGARYGYTWRTKPPSVKASGFNPLTGTFVEQEFDLGSRQDGRGSIDLSLLLLDFGATAGRIRQAEWAERIAEAEATRVDREVALAAARAYFELLLARHLEDAARATLESAGLAEADAQNLARSGMALANDVLRAEVRVSNAERSLAQARGRRAIAEAALWNVLGYPEVADRTVLDEVPEVAALGPLERYLAGARERRPEVELVRSRLAFEREGLRVSVAGLLPRLVLRGSYVHLDDPIIANPDWFEGGFAVEWDLFTGFRRRSERAAARARIDAATERGQAILDRISLEVTEAYEETRTARSALAFAARAEQQAQENWKVVRERNRQGLATATDRADADAALEGARQEHAAARFRHVAAAARLAIAAGYDDPLALCVPEASP
ncbi:MAG: TolC family protein [Planctomycetes bacterium]|nr:TolC family protein [Planctomycetota bacterium]